ncbi:MAG: hypothetical protein RBS57_15030, partial [Desulforhabdus sp.]|nr:hypothetical protein [Desulforhabdus sp.]
MGLSTVNLIRFFLIDYIILASIAGLTIFSSDSHGQSQKPVHSQPLITYAGIDACFAFLVAIHCFDVNISKHQNCAEGVRQSTYDTGIW